MQDTEQKIWNVENGLVEFVPDRADKRGAVRNRSLSDRMGYYQVPGVSLALINNYDVEWSKAYGVLKARSDKQVQLHQPNYSLLSSSSIILSKENWN